MKPATKKYLIIGSIVALVATCVTVAVIMHKKPKQLSDKPDVNDVDGMIRKEVEDLLKIMDPKINDEYIKERSDEQLKADLKAMILNKPI